MNFVFKPELPPVPNDKWYNAAVKLKEVVGDREFTVYSIKNIFGIDGNQAMTLLSYLVMNRMVTTVYDV